MKYRPIHLTEKQKANATAFQNGGHVEGGAPLSDDLEWMKSPEGQAALTADSLRAIAEADAPRRSPPAKSYVYDGPAAVPVELREDQRRIAAPSRFMLAGNATFTIVSKKTGARFTYRVRQPRGEGDNLPHFVAVLTGSDNESDYTFLGSIFSDGNYRPGRKSTISQTAPSAKAFAWFWEHVNDSDLSDRLDIYHEGRCCRCGRKLTVPSSIESGIGPECATKE